MTANDYTPIAEGALPLDPNGLLAEDLFILLPTAHRYIRYFAAGEAIDATRMEQLKRHSHIKLFKKVPDSLVIKGTTRHYGSSTKRQYPNPEQLSEEFRASLLSAEAKEKVQRIFKSITDPSVSAEEAIRAIEGQTDEVLSVIAPDLKDLKGHLLKSMSFTHLMDNASAITSLSVFVAVGAGFDSKKPLRDLSIASLIMDISLTDVSEEELNSYYLNPQEVDADLQKRIHSHPSRSHEIATSKLKSLSDVALQLILSHHELFNGRGYPRKVRTESLFPMVKILSLAVDVFEQLKKAELSETQDRFSDILLRFKNEPVEAHLRRHSKKLLDQVTSFYGITPPSTG